MIASCALSADAQGIFLAVITPVGSINDTHNVLKVSLHKVSAVADACSS